MSTLFDKAPAELVDIMKRAGSNDPDIAKPAQRLFGKAISLPLNEALLAGDILDGLFQTVNLTNGEALEDPLDVLNPNEEEDFIAWVCPDQGRIPERQVSSDYIALKTYKIANSIDMNLRVIRDANWDVFARALQVMQAGFVMKMNVDGWRVLLASAESRGLEVIDTAATQGFMSRRLFSLMNIEMRRNGGRFTHLNRRMMTHMFMSPEAMEDIRLWDVTEVDEITRRELYLTESQSLASLGRTILVDLDEFGVGETHNDYYLNLKGNPTPGFGTVANPKEELVVGVDLRNPPFVMPVREALMVTQDDNMHRFQKAGWYGWFESGFAALDNRYLLAGAI